ncbi:D-Ala-D-Ala carboxypeptidase family metallohydrolase [uncultured Tateyamaria sp.]|uniref:D-Ala-D-Ala carboxypeptidase family metallohydrolase n=1 Tax=uncultured Tateyamaria sp. TaxID=455651 RepID=UPI00262457F8|nr:D-Ala-D-Ala carboxypeptidase family metallohydrolase [uncultured Tateyamaria sp.]
MDEELRRLQALRDELIAAAAEVGQSALTPAEKARRISEINFEIDDIDVVMMDHAATQINATSQAVVAATEAAGRNVLGKVLDGLSAVVASIREDVQRIIRDITPDPVAVIPNTAPTPAIVNPVADDPVMLRRSSGTRAVYGHLVRAMQNALSNAGFSTNGVDMIFGDDTANALLAWRASTGRSTLDAIITKNEFTDLTGQDEVDLFDFCAQATASFEGHGFGKIVGDFDGAVMTWGYHGYTLKFGHLQAVLDRIEAKGPQTLDAVFGSERASQVRQMLQMPLQGQLDWARQNVLDGQSKIRSDWHTQFADLGEQESARTAMLEHSREAFWDGIAVPQATLMGLHEPLSLGMLFDAAIQQGGASNSTLEKVKAARAANPNATEMSLREVLAKALRAQLSNSKWADDVFARRRAFISGRGKVHSVNYDLGAWGFFASDDENEGRIIPPRLPEITQMPAIQPSQRSFAQFFEDEIQSHAPNFSATELLYPGGGNAAGACKGLNTDPPEDLWQNAVALSKLLQAIRDEFGAPLRISSCYRSPEYNSCIGGASRSQHMRFTAADITIANGNTPLTWYNKILEMRNRGIFSGGIGRYNTFVHVDVRGENATW